jgi:hypothetical protein
MRAMTLIAAVGLAACGTTTASGRVGSTLSGGGVSVTLQRLDRHPPVPSGDVTGLSVPAPGQRLVGARFRVCSTAGQAIGTFNFVVNLQDGGSEAPKYAAQNYPDSFGVVRTGCTAGWIVFQIPRTSRPQAVAFKFDDTGDQTSVNVPGRHPEVHDHFSWTL